MRYFSIWPPLCVRHIIFYFKNNYYIIKSNWNRQYLNLIVHKPWNHFIVVCIIKIKRPTCLGQTGCNSLMVWGMFSWHTLSPSNPVEHILNATANNLSICIGILIKFWCITLHWFLYISIDIMRVFFPPQPKSLTMFYIYLHTSQSFLQDDTNVKHHIFIFQNEICI